MWKLYEEYQLTANLHLIYSPWIFTTFADYYQNKILWQDYY